MNLWNHQKILYTNNRGADLLSMFSGFGSQGKQWLFGQINVPYLDLEALILVIFYRLVIQEYQTENVMV